MASKDNNDDSVSPMNRWLAEKESNPTLTGWARTDDSSDDSGSESEGDETESESEDDGGTHAGEDGRRESVDGGENEPPVEHTDTQPRNTEEETSADSDNGASQEDSKTKMPSEDEAQGDGMAGEGTDS
ncbi:hypothetical protein B0I35DRAFT_480122 [Stachybotrys elegans]|uniref:Uncharacterized protein n=1 Tax=Stachybotrys elegans TaxID=80388 RepID=A0A8K0WNX2_9HYPO|nr:hypothetical protein B0I35DRAFT_480122 [Stachybotrys elegans]